VRKLNEFDRAFNVRSILFLFFIPLFVGQGLTTLLQFTQTVNILATLNRLEAASLVGRDSEDQIKHAESTAARLEASTAFPLLDIDRQLDTERLNAFGLGRAASPPLAPRFRVDSNNFDLDSCSDHSDRHRTSTGFFFFFKVVSTVSS
jgi:hypothetical protein